MRQNNDVNSDPIKLALQMGGDFLSSILNVQQINLNLLLYFERVTCIIILEFLSILIGHKLKSSLCVFFLLLRHNILVLSSVFKDRCILGGKHLLAALKNSWSRE